jgi:hypothetical protein
MLGMCVIPLYNIVDAPLGIGINARLPFDVTKVCFIHFFPRSCSQLGSEEEEENRRWASAIAVDWNPLSACSHEQGSTATLWRCVSLCFRHLILQESRTPNLVNRKWLRVSQWWKAMKRLVWLLSFTCYSDRRCSLFRIGHRSRCPARIWIRYDQFYSCCCST